MVIKQQKQDELLFPPSSLCPELPTTSIILLCCKYQQHLLFSLVVSIILSPGEN
jgi:hypothetical protein